MICRNFTRIFFLPHHIRGSQRSNKRYKRVNIVIDLILCFAFIWTFSGLKCYKRRHFGNLSCILTMCLWSFAVFKSENWGAFWKRDLSSLKRLFLKRWNNIFQVWLNKPKKPYVNFSDTLLWFILILNPWPLHVKMAPPCYIGTTYSQNLVQYAIMMIGRQRCRNIYIRSNWTASNVDPLKHKIRFQGPLCLNASEHKAEW